ncbi:hypothetical protein Q9966_004813 [Columba livia]|nr:hypothetical protein Q9966_004813 [Columba livia]
MLFIFDARKIMYILSTSSILACIVCPPPPFWLFQAELWQERTLCIPAWSWLLRGPGAEFVQSPLVLLLVLQGSNSQVSCKMMCEPAKSLLAPTAEEQDRPSYRPSAIDPAARAGKKSHQHRCQGGAGIQEDPIYIVSSMADKTLMPKILIHTRESTVSPKFDLNELEIHHSPPGSEKRF